MTGRARPGRRPSTIAVAALDRPASQDRPGSWRSLPAGAADRLPARRAAEGRLPTADHVRRSTRSLRPGRSPAAHCARTTGWCCSASRACSTRYSRPIRAGRSPPRPNGNSPDPAAADGQTWPRRRPVVRAAVFHPGGRGTACRHAGRSDENPGRRWRAGSGFGWPLPQTLRRSGCTARSDPAKWPAEDRPATRAGLRTGCESPTSRPSRHRRRPRHPPQRSPKPGRRAKVGTATPVASTSRLPAARESPPDHPPTTRRQNTPPAAA
jgi:hypothetical protein